MTHPVDRRRHPTARPNAAPPAARAYLDRVARRRPAGPGPRRPRLRQLRPRLRRRERRRQGQLQARGQAERRDRVQLQRHALGAPAVRRRSRPQIKAAVRDAGGVAQFAGGVPAMCDGITQGRAGMELSLYSRDVIAMATAIALSHDMFDAALMLGVCDKIVPGLLIGALSFGHLPTLFVPAGPMTSGLSNALKSKVRQQYATGEIGRDELLAAEAAAYHGPGTCTFYGTANSNQMLMELMGLHLPGASFVNPGTPLRTALTEAAGRAGRRAGRERRSPTSSTSRPSSTGWSRCWPPAGRPTTRCTWSPWPGPRASTCAGTTSPTSPPSCRCWPGSTPTARPTSTTSTPRAAPRSWCASSWARASCTATCRPWSGRGCDAYTTEPMLVDGQLTWRDGPTESLDLDVLRPVDDPFDKDGGLRMLAGNLGRAVIKTSAVAPEQRLIEAPARVFDDQSEFQAAFEAGELDRRRRRRRPLPGPEGQRHARAAQADPGAGCAAGPRPPGRAGHRRPDVRRVGQDPGGHPRHARGRRGRQSASRGSATATWSGSTPTRAPSRCWSTPPSSRPPGGRPAGPRVRGHRPGAVRVLPPRRRPGRRGRQHLRRRSHEFPVLDVAPVVPGRRTGRPDEGRAAGPRAGRGRPADRSS